MYDMNNLKKIRKEKGYTIYDMAQKLNITPSYYSQLENKKEGSSMIWPIRLLIFLI